MALAHDASSPAAVTLLATSTPGVETGTTASFSPPAASLLTCRYIFQGNTTSALAVTTPTNTGTALTWNSAGTQAQGGGFSGYVAIYWAYNTNSQTGITVTGGCTSDGNSSTAGTQLGTMLIDVWTGTTTSMSGAAFAGGTNTSSATIAALHTTTVQNSQSIACAIEVNNTLALTSADTLENAQDAGSQDSQACARKASTNGAPGPVSVGFTTSGGAFRWTWAVFELLPLQPTISAQPTSQYAHPGDSVTFSVTASSSGGSLTYQWYKNGSSVGGATSSSYTVTPNYPADYGALWYCAVTDNNGTLNSNSVAVLWLVQTKFGPVSIALLDAGDQDYKSTLTILRWF